MSKSQIKWVTALGRKSGVNFDKMACLRRKDAIVSWKYFELLKGDFAQLLLLKIDTILTGDHTTFIYEVKHTKNIQDEAASACDVGGEIKESVKNMQKKIQKSIYLNATKSALYKSTCVVS